MTPCPRRDRDMCTPDIALVQQQDLERLRRAIAALPPHYRDVLVLVELAERSYAEVAAICGCELNTVRSRLFRARGLLARWLALDAGAPDAMSAAHGYRPEKMMTAPLLDDRLRALSVALDDAGPPASVDRAIAAAVVEAASHAANAASGARHSRALARLAGRAGRVDLRDLVHRAPGAAATTRCRRRRPRRCARRAQTFMPVVSAEEIARAGDTYLMPARLPRMTLAQLGFAGQPGAHRRRGRNRIARPSRRRRARAALRPLIDPRRFQETSMPRLPSRCDC